MQLLIINYIFIHEHYTSYYSQIIEQSTCMTGVRKHVVDNQPTKMCSIIQLVLTQNETVDN